MTISCTTPSSAGGIAVEGGRVDLGIAEGVAVAVGVSEGGSVGTGVTEEDVGVDVGIATGVDEHALRTTTAIARMRPIRKERRFMWLPPW
jgi:hypothetical protein